jgi:hypothetical protein
VASESHRLALPLGTVVQCILNLNREIEVAIATLSYDDD